jgi:ankyrin repeat protein
MIPLHSAADNGHVEIVHLLLQNGADVNAKDKYGETPLHEAAGHGHIDILHLLAENGADLEAQSNYGRRALHCAALLDNLPFVQELVSRYHVDINARDRYGDTALWTSRIIGVTATAAFLEENGGSEDGVEEDEEQEQDEEEDNEDEEDNVQIRP